MNEPRIVTPQEASKATIRYRSFDDLAFTIAAEPDRVRTAVVQALRNEVERAAKGGVIAVVEWLEDAADDIENGADYA